MNAIRVLRRLLPSQDINPLLGDIAEEARHRSRLWYWAQILAVVLVGSGRDIWRHPWLAMRAVGVGIASLIAYSSLLRTMVEGLTYVNSGFSVAGHWIQWSPRVDSNDLALEVILLTELCLLLFGAAASGWIVGRLHRAHGIAMVVCFAAFVALLSAAATLRMALLTSEWASLNVIRIALSVGLLAVAPVTIVIGGFCAARPTESAQ